MHRICVDNSLEFNKNALKRSWKVLEFCGWDLLLTLNQAEDRVTWPDLPHQHTIALASFREWSVVSAWLRIRAQPWNPCQPRNSASASTCSLVPFPPHAWASSFYDTVDYLGWYVGICNALTKFTSYDHGKTSDITSSVKNLGNIWFHTSFCGLNYHCHVVYDSPSYMFYCGTFCMFRHRETNRS